MDTMPNRPPKRPAITDYRFNTADILLTVLAMVLLIAGTWWTLVALPGDRPETAEITVRLRVRDVPDGAEGKIAVGDTLYTAGGEAFGNVSGISYVRPDGANLRAYMELTMTAQNLYNGYGIVCGEETLLLTLGGYYDLHTKNFGGASFCCVEITENAA